MDKGQHLRLLLSKTISQTSYKKVIALSTDFTFHMSATTENSTTKDSTDIDGLWDEFEITAKSYDISVTAMIGVGTDGDNANTLNDFLTQMTDTPLQWELAVFSGTNNRTTSTANKIASGECKITSINPVGQNRQFATYSASLNGYGPITVASGT